MSDTVTVTPNAANPDELDMGFSGGLGGGFGLLQCNLADGSAVWNSYADGASFWISPDIRAAMFINPAVVANVPGLFQDAADVAGGQAVGNLAGANLSSDNVGSLMQMTPVQIIGLASAVVSLVGAGWAAYQNLSNSQPNPFAACGLVDPSVSYGLGGLCVGSGIDLAGPAGGYGGGLTGSDPNIGDYGLDPNNIGGGFGGGMN